MIADEELAVDKILIIGGSGTVGTHLLDEIVRQGISERRTIVCACRSDTARQKIETKGLDTLFVDLRAPASVRAALEGISTIFLLKPYGLKMLNYAKTVVDAASDAGVRAIVNLSAFGPDDSSIDLLTWHRLVDAYVERSGLAFTHLRPGFFMESLAARINMAAGAIYDLSGSLPIPWIAAADIARAAATILADPSKHAGQAYSLVAEFQSAPNIAALLAGTVHKPFTVVAMDEVKTIDALIARGREPLFASAIVEYAKTAATFAEEPTHNFEGIIGASAISLQQYLETMCS